MRNIKTWLTKVRLNLRRSKTVRSLVRVKRSWSPGLLRILKQITEHIVLSALNRSFTCWGSSCLTTCTLRTSCFMISRLTILLLKHVHDRHHLLHHHHLLLRIVLLLLDHLHHLIYHLLLLLSQTVRHPAWRMSVLVRSLEILEIVKHHIHAVIVYELLSRVFAFILF